MTNEDLLQRKDIKSINGYEGIYVISNSGDVWSLSRPYINNKGKTTKIKPIKKINSFLDGKGNYKMVGLSKDGKRIKYLLHRLVAITFIEKKHGKDEVNHIDGNKQNNYIENLEWCSRIENIRHSIDTGLKKITKGKEILQKDRQGRIIAEHKSIRSAGRSIGKEMGNIANCCRGAVKTAYGYIWEYK